MADEDDRSRTPSPIHMPPTKPRHNIGRPPAPVPPRTDLPGLPQQCPECTQTINNTKFAMPCHRCKKWLHAKCILGQKSSLNNEAFKQMTNNRVPVLCPRCIQEEERLRKKIEDLQGQIKESDNVIQGMSARRNSMMESQGPAAELMEKLKGQEEENAKLKEALEAAKKIIPSNSIALELQKAKNQHELEIAELKKAIEAAKASSSVSAPPATDPQLAILKTKCVELQQQILDVEREREMRRIFT